MKFFINKEKAFTLAELLVAMSVFIVIVSIAVGVFLRTIKNERRLITTMNMMSNLNFSLEQIAREIRGGYLFSGSPNVCTSTIAFKNFEGADIVYSLDGGTILRNNLPLTSSNINVGDLCFLLINSSSTEICDPWRIGIFLSVAPRQSEDFIKPFYIQTTVSSRILPKEIPIIYKRNSIYAYCE
jgi:type II secretory pathway pseudopilin PulG